MFPYQSLKNPNPYPFALRIPLCRAFLFCVNLSSQKRYIAFFLLCVTAINLRVKASTSPYTRSVCLIMSRHKQSTVIGKKHLLSRAANRVQSQTISFTYVFNNVNSHRGAHCLWRKESGLHLSVCASMVRTMMTFV